MTDKLINLLVNMLISMLNISSSPKAREILDLLLEGETSLSDISICLKISKPATLKYLNEMESMGLISSETKTTKVGREKRFKIRSYSHVISIDPHKGAIIYKNNDPLNLENPLVGQITQDEFRNAVKVYITKIAKNVRIGFVAVLYGSIARGEGTQKSDIDLLFLSKIDWDKKEKKIVMDALHEGSIETQIQVKPLFWTLKDFHQKRDNLTKRMKREGLILHDTIGDEQLWKTMKRYWSITG